MRRRGWDEVGVSVPFRTDRYTNIVPSQWWSRTKPCPPAGAPHQSMSNIPHRLFRPYPVGWAANTEMVDENPLLLLLTFKPLHHSHFRSARTWACYSRFPWASQQNDRTFMVWRDPPFLPVEGTWTIRCFRGTPPFLAVLTPFPRRFVMRRNLGNRDLKTPPHL